MEKFNSIKHQFKKLRKTFQGEFVNCSCRGDVYIIVELIAKLILG